MVTLARSPPRRAPLLSDNGFFVSAKWQLMFEEIKFNGYFFVSQQSEASRTFSRRVQQPRGRGGVLGDGAAVVAPVHVRVHPRQHHALARRLGAARPVR